MNTTLKRSIFGVIFLAVMLGGLLLGKVPYVILFTLITVIMMEEFYRITMGESFRSLQHFAACMGGALFCIVSVEVFRGEPLSAAVLPGILLVLAIMVYSIFQKDHTDFMKTGFLYAGFLYMALPLALSSAVVYRDGAFSGLLMLAFFCIIWASDVGAYCFGMAIGQKLWPAKLCPKISPKKSWAGYIGGLLTAVLAGAVIHWTGLVSIPMIHCLAMAAVMHVFGVFGDLFESLWKRAAGVKDSGNVIPGHGGLWDRFDSALFAIPAGYLYLMSFSLV